MTVDCTRPTSRKGELHFPRRTVDSDLRVLEGDAHSTLAKGASISAAVALAQTTKQRS